jgi:predicted AAA+ superfamily ATPase
MSLRKNGYIKRIVDHRIEEYLNIFGALLIEGPKWCGKTWTALNHANSVAYIMDPNDSYSNKTLAKINPALLLPGKKPRLIDEWQEAPGIWDAVRFDVDQAPGYGKYLLTGSATPPRETYAHSGAGRIAIIRMRPMTLSESGDSTNMISLKSIFEGEEIEPYLADIDLLKLIDISVRGGWPETLNMSIKKAGNVASEYINAITRNEMLCENQSKRNPAKMLKLLKSLARNNATTASIKTLSMDTDGSERKDQNEDDIKISRDSVTEYLKVLKEIFVIEELSAWNPEVRSKTIIRSAAKRIFADPSLAVASLNLSRNKLVQDFNTFGFIFENLCLRDLLVYADFYQGHLFHYHDNSDLEVDAIIEMPDGKWGAFEIKLGEHQVDTAARSLCLLRDKMVSNGAEHPSCLCVITGGGFGRKRDDGVYVIPINSLKP